MWFDSEAALKLFAESELEQVLVPPEARKLLSRYFEVSRHYEVRESVDFACV